MERFGRRSAFRQRDHRSSPTNALDATNILLSTAVRDYCQKKSKPVNEESWLAFEEIPSSAEIVPPSLSDYNDPSGWEAFDRNQARTRSPNSEDGRGLADLGGSGSHAPGIKTDDTNISTFENDPVDVGDSSDYQSRLPLECLSNKVKEPWLSKMEYLRMHYQLLREEAVQPLREAVAKVRDNPEAREDQFGGDVGIYERVDAHLRD